MFDNFDYVDSVLRLYEDNQNQIGETYHGPLFFIPLIFLSYFKMILCFWNYR